MTTDTEIISNKSFVRSYLPWLVAAGAMILYLATLNHWVTAESITHVSRIGDWDWQPTLYPPVFYVVTLPFRLLRPATLPIALNCFAAVCATLTLALLARSVALLPHDRTNPQRERETGEFALLSIRGAWLPLVLAVIVCGLQLTFWENATAASSEIFDLLLFAYAIRCLLEYRIDPRNSWLARAAFVFGAGMANNWPMVAFLPFFIAAIFWIKGRAFLDARFLVRTAAWGLLGMSFYFLMPAILGWSLDSPANFWQAFRAELGGQKSYLFHLPYKSLWVMGLYSLLPLAIIGIRWAASFGDNTPMGAAVAAFTFHVVHAAFFLVCIWVAFDPPLSPRRFPDQFGIDLPFLKLYYLNALAVGYFAGYFLLVFGKAPEGQSPRGVLALINRGVTLAVWLLLLLVPFGLLYKNLPQIRLANSSLLKDYSKLLLESLPPNGAVILSDDARRLLLLKATLNERDLKQKYVLFNTTLLKHVEYFRYVERKYSMNWKKLNLPRAKAQFTGRELMNILQKISQNNSIYYLHPTFGYYIEQFYLRPHGIVYEMRPYPGNSLAGPALTPELIAENKTFWANAEKSVLPSVLKALSQPKIPREPGLGREFMLRFHVTREADEQAAVLAKYYSLAMNFWGVELQKNDRWEEAGPFFSRALEVNPENRVAAINFNYNQNVRAGKTAGIPLLKSMDEEFGKYRDWPQLMSVNGMFDEPNRCAELGRVFAGGELTREAAQQFERVRTLTPDNIFAQLWLAQFYLVVEMPDRTLNLIAALQPKIKSGSLDKTSTLQLGLLEAVAHFKRKEPDEGIVTLNQLLDKFPNEEELFTATTRLYLEAGRYTNALEVINKHLKFHPENTSALVNKGFVCIQLNDYPTAIVSLDHALSLQNTNYEARFNRAIANLRNGNYDAAQQDYELLKDMFPKARQIYFGLGEIAYHKKDTSAAIHHFEMYLSNSPADNPENKLIFERLNQLNWSR